MDQSIAQRIFLRALRQLGAKQLSWDQRFKDEPSCYGPRSPHTIRNVVDLCRGGTLVEFGCGEGDLAFVLPPGTYASYEGYDISAVAINRAKQRAAKSGRNCSFHHCDIAEWNGTSRAKLILLEECIYYLSSREISRFLLQCARCLTPDGSILVIVHSGSKHASALEACRRTCRVSDEVTIGERVFLTLKPA